MNTEETIGTPARRRGRGTRIALIAGGVVLALLGFVAALPTLVSMGMFRGTVISYATDAVNGTVTIGSLELGWFSGVGVRDVVIDDPAHGTRIEANASARQGLWALATKGIAGLDAKVAAKVRTKRMADGSLGIAALAKAPAPGAPVPSPTKAAEPFRLPAGLDATLTLERIELQVDAADGSKEGSLLVEGGQVRVLGGGRSSVALKGSSEWQGTAGGFEIEAGGDGIVAADGSLAFAKVPADVRVRASRFGFSAGGLAIRVDDADVKVASKDLTGQVDVAASVHASVEGGEPCSVEADLHMARVLSPAGAFVMDLGGVSGSVRAAGVPTAPFERFVRGTSLVLARDLGARVDASASFAAADGSGLHVEVRSERMQLVADGALDPKSGAADLRTVTLVATVDPALVASAGIVVSAPARVEAALTDVHVPGTGDDGAFRVDDVAFAADARIDVQGLQVPGPDGRVPLDIASIRLRASAKPVGAGIEADLSASRPGGAARSEMQVTASLRNGGPLGMHGSVRVASLPTAFVRPFVPASVPVDVVRDIGDAVRTLDVAVGAGDRPEVLVSVEAPKVTVSLRGTVAADGALRTTGASSIALREVRPELLGAYGVPVAAPIDVTVRIAELALPAPKPFALGACGIDAEIDVAGPRGGTFPVRIGAAQGGGTPDLQVGAVHATVRGVEIGREAAVKLQATVDGAAVTASVEAKGLGAMTIESIEAAQLRVAVDAPSIEPALVAARAGGGELLPHLGSGPLAIAFRYDGSLQAGKGSVRAARTDLQANATVDLRRDSLVAEGSAQGTLQPSGFRALAPDVPCTVAGPLRVEASAGPLTVARPSAWEFASPSAVRASVRVPSARLQGVPGLRTDVGLGAVAVHADVTLAPASAAKVVLEPVSVTAEPASGSLAVARVAANASWSAATGTAAAQWSADLSVTGVEGAGVEALLDLPEDARGRIGSGGTVRAAMKAAPGGGIAFDVQSRVPTLAATLVGDWTDGALTLRDSSAQLTIQGPQLLALLNRGERTPRADGSVPPPPWKSAGALEVNATIPALHLASGKAPLAVVRLDTKELVLVPAEGAPVTVAPVLATVDMPGAGRPASVSLRTAIGAAGAKGSAPVEVEATLRDWCRADGTLDLQSIQPDGRVEVREASSAVLGALLGMPAGELPQAVGPTATLLATLRSTGPGMAVADAKLTSQYLNAAVPACRYDHGTLLVDAAKPVRVEFVPSDPLRHRVLEPINPVFRDVRLADEKKPIVLQVSTLSYPLDGAMAKVSADADLTVGDVLLDSNPDNDVLNLLKVFQSQGGKPIQGRIDPLRVTVRAGQLTYKDFNIYIERQGDAWVTRLIFDGDIDLTRSPPFARKLAANYPFSSVARSVLNVIPNEDGGGSAADILNTLSMGAADAIQLRVTMRGPLGDVNGRPAKLERKVKIDFRPDALEKGVGNAVKDIGKSIGDIFGGAKKDAPKKPAQPKKGSGK